MSIDDTYYDNTAPLVGPGVPVHLHRRIGVRVAGYRPRHPGLGGADAWETTSETVSLNTVATFGCAPVAEVEARITDRTRWVIDELDAALTELWSHRERLALEHLRRTGEGLHCPPGAPILRLLIEAQKTTDRLRQAGQACRDVLRRLGDAEGVEATAWDALMHEVTP